VEEKSRRGFARGHCLDGLGFRCADEGIGHENLGTIAQCERETTGKGIDPHESHIKSSLLSGKQRPAVKLPFPATRCFL